MNQQLTGKFISLCRKSQKITQEQLAQKLGVSKNAVSKWERGLNLPDASLMSDLCQELDISLDELFAGQYLNEKKVPEDNRLSFWRILRIKKHLIIKVILLLVILLITGKFVLVKMGYLIDSDLGYSQIYIAQEGNIKGDIDIKRFGRVNIDFDIGANKYGKAVFKDPNKAFRRLCQNYQKGISLIQEEFNLLPLSNFTYKYYLTYGNQVTSGSDIDREQAGFVASFLDIYDNSFN
ncbi:MAG: helix-turn-helix transcriptional regulator [Erysipelotrichaceae bacterium]